MKFLKSRWPAWPGHTEEELASLAGLLFPYKLRKSDGCNLLKTKLEFASSSKAHGPLGGAIRKRNALPGRIAFAYQLRKSDGCNLLKTKLEFASSSKACCPLGGAIRERNLARAGASLHTEASTGSGSRPMDQWCC